MAKPIFVMELRDHSIPSCTMESVHRAIADELSEYHVLLMKIPDDAVPKCYIVSENCSIDVHNIDLCAWNQVK